ncbi:hypothetical protein HFN80_32555 [Rhizobium laguerreae]|uniref:dual OB domain-containing protein n=1 Tax=Rhizobium laguerreae TaxID=1076926 RepID=UPI001C914380|nr:hypothetical protein [Rhizobium laguerreae]MBY3468660.1 hypothetical protein [Rhizobium laguerreae]
MTKAEYSKTIVCLANSRKHAGRCIAGKVLEGREAGTWVRPVSGRSSGELSLSDRTYKDGVSAALFDIITVSMKAPAPHPFQTENHLIDDGFFWTNLGKASWHQIGKLIDNFTGPIWEDVSSSYNGKLDRVPENSAAHAVACFGSSLTLIEVDNLDIIVQVEGAEFNNPSRHVRGDFTYGGNSYRMMITDPDIESEFFARTNGSYHVGEALLCISLGEAYNGFAYKLIAAVFRP